VAVVALEEMGHLVDSDVLQAERLFVMKRGAVLCWR
jgi:hypothetical protein